MGREQGLAQAPGVTVAHVVGPALHDGRQFLELDLAGGVLVDEPAQASPKADAIGPLEAAVVGIPDPEFGQRLKAVVIRKRETTLDQSMLLDWLKPRVARYQMPAVTEFREQLPYTPLGKVDKKSLRG